MMNDKIQKAFNEQLKHEMDSAYLYLSAAAYMHHEGLDGMAQWLRVQSQEELVHARKFFDHIRDRGGRVTLLALDKPRGEWSSPLDVWRDVHKHEQFITGKINELAALAREISDFPSGPLLHWFHDEQIEEEASTFKVAQQLERIGGSGAGLTMLDRELGKREFKDGPVF